MNDVGLASHVLAEARYLQAGREAGAHRHRRLRVARDRPQVAAAKIAEQVTAVQVGDRAAAVDDAARRREPERAAVLRDRRQGIRIRAAGAAERVRAFEAAPAVIAAEHDAVHFLERALSHVGEPQLVADAIEAPAPWIAETVSVDLGAVGRARPARAPRVRCERIAVRTGRNRVGRRGARVGDVDAQHLAQQGGQQLGVADVAVRVAAAAAVADADVEEAVRAERDVAAVVVALRVIDVEELQLGSGREGIAAVQRTELRDAIDEPERRIRSPYRRDTPADPSGSSDGKPCRAGRARRSRSGGPN